MSTTPAAHLPLHSPLRSGTMGEDTLKRFTVTIDWPDHELYLEKNREWGELEIFDEQGFLTTSMTTEKSLKVVAVLPKGPGNRAGVKLDGPTLRCD